MFQISVAREFCAAHALVIRGLREPVHGHNFHLTVTLQGDRLDADGLLLDFHALERLLDEILHPLTNADLNAAPGLANPTAELVAKHIADRVVAGLPAIAPAGAPLPRLASVRLTEAPGCAVVYLPDQPAG
jgi:6-pyruvoyltetrahydropterin/6-carboxytetrahydropterin synthase